MDILDWILKFICGLAILFIAYQVITKIIIPIATVVILPIIVMCILIGLSGLIAHYWL